MNWFRKKKEPEVVHHMYDILPPFDWENATSETATEYLKGLSRIQILEIHDRDIIPDHLWDEFYEVKNQLTNWPTDDEVIAVCNKLDWNSDSLSKQFRTLVKQVEGMQKKLDRATKILEKAEIKMSGKTALEL